MLYRSKELTGRALGANDGEIGSIADVYFDDERWTVRYLVVDTGGWLSGRKVLISPASLAREQGSEGPLLANLTREQVENSPGEETDRPVSRDYEAVHADYYNYPAYWSGPELWGPESLPLGGAIAEVQRDVQRARAKQAMETAQRDTHLRSCKEVADYGIHATDGDIGHLVDFLIDPESWRIRHLLVATRNWLPGKNVLVDPAAIERVRWAERKIYVNVAREEIESAPEYPG